jgi:hypothetical protein
MNFREIYRIAKDQLESLSTVDKPDFRLEQAEYKKKDKLWEVVVSYLVDKDNEGRSAIAKAAAFEVFNNPYERVYKTVKINDNQKVVGFYIYQS